MTSAGTPGPPPPLDGLGQLLPQLAIKFPHKTALVTDERQMSFVDLDRDSTKIAAALARRGVKPGDRVSLLAQNRWEWIVAYHGVLKVGAVVNPMNVMLTGEEVAYILNDAGVSALIGSAERLNAVRSQLPELGLIVSFDASDADDVEFASLLAEEVDDFVAPPVDPAGLACIAYTSGTTGHPKGAMQSHRSLVLNCAYTATMHGRTPDEVVVTALPAPHVYGNVVINGTFLAGGTVVLMTRFDAAGALERIGRHRATLFEGVPTMYALMLANPAIENAQLHSLTRSTVGGQTIATSVIEAWEARTGAPLIELWGMTELSGLGSTHAVFAPNVHGSIGVALPGVELRVERLDEPGVECAIDEPGELLVRGPLVMMGYFGNPDATAETIDADRWLHTGDVATHDGLGHITVVDRLKDVILTGGYNVYPAEIERVMIAHPAVALVAVGKQVDEVKGEVAHAYVVLAPNATTDVDELIAFAREHLAAYKVPRAVHFVEQIPTTSSGKIMRRKLRVPEGA